LYRPVELQIDDLPDDDGQYGDRGEPLQVP
jgi:hypothetical protein